MQILKKLFIFELVVFSQMIVNGRFLQSGCFFVTLL
jgi:hypothetical protein